MKKTKIAAMLAAMQPSAAVIAPKGNSQTVSNEKRGFYSIKAAAGGVAELIMYGDVGWDFSAKQIASDLRAMGKITQLKAYIQSGGGDVMDGMAIYNILARWPCQKSICIESVAASMASVICMAFDTVIMPSNAFLMIHSNWGGAVGTADDLREYADLLDKWRSSMGKAYQDKAAGKLSDEQLAQFFKEDTWLTAQEAVALGLADEVIEPMQMAASIDFKRLKDFNNMPKAMQTLLQQQANVGETPTAATTAPTTTAPAAAVPPTTPAAVQPDAATIQAAAIAFNSERMKGINTAFAFFPELADLHNQCIADANINAEKAKDLILAKLGENTTPCATLPRTSVHSGNGNIVGDSIRAHLMARSGHAKAESSNNYSSYTMLELARASLLDRGIGCAGFSKMDMVGLAFTHSSSDFGNILLDVANKSVLMGWETAEETFERWTKKGQLGNFNIARRIGLGDFNSLRQVREGAEYKYVTVGDHAQQIALATYGELFSITRQAIINDDMSMLTDIPMKMGFAAKGTIGDLVYAVLTQNPKMADGKTLFHADHGNLGSGAPSMAALDANRQLMRKQKSGKRPLNIRPAFVLCPVTLETTMNQIIKSSSVKGADVNSGIVNPIQNFAEVIGEPRLDDSSATQWFLAAGKGRDTIEVAYLDGIDTPYIEQQQGFTIDGVATKVRIDAGVAPLDHRGLVKSTGV
ncbi:ClpP-like prohead protease/major capsid protein fusion protein [Shewanella sp.]|uniref:ClpP-like prohead protease/major capsid protein fusion protein n=1 Tax=Shewanella sp. TaxID=50422 RepID=UPI0040539D88